MKRLFGAVSTAMLCLVLTHGSGFGADIQYSGFLGNYGDLKEGPQGGVAMRYLKPDVDFSKYRKVMLDFVVFFLANDAEYKGINAEDMKELSDAFNKAAVDALNKDYPLVGEPGPDVLRIRVAVTHLKPSKPGSAAVTTIIPVGLAISLIKRGATGEYTGVGSTGIEAEFLDSLSNERVAAVVDQQAGGKMSGFAKWGAAKEAFEFWAGRLKAFLDNTRGGAAPRQQ